MSIFADLFVDMMPSTITVQPMTARSDDGTPTYGTAQSYASRINNKQKNVIGGDGQMVVARGTAYIDTVDAITANDLVTFPDGTKPIILNVNQVPDETGPAYTSLDFQ